MLVYERVSQPLTRTSMMRWATHRVIPAPGFIAPALPTVARSVPEGPLWVHEIKHDGYRLLVRKLGDQVRVMSY